MQLQIIISWWIILSAYLMLYTTLLGKRGKFSHIAGLSLILAVVDGSIVLLIKQLGLPYGLHIPFSMIFMALVVGVYWKRLWFGFGVALLSYLTMIVMDVFTGILIVKVFNQQSFLQRAIEDWRLMVAVGQLQTLPIYFAAWWTGRKQTVWFNLYQRRIRA